MIKVIFMGTPDYAEEILKKLITDSEIEVVSVYTQPDKPVGRKKLLTPPPVKKVALEEGIEVFQPNSLREDRAIESVLNQECDFIVVAAYGQILPKAILKHAPCINLHASILPKYRGASPIQQAILNGDTKTGVTAMLMDEGLDTGDIIKIVECEIDQDEMVEELFEKLTHIAADLTLDVVKNFHSYTPVPQNDIEASYCKKITKEDGRIEFDDARTIYNKYRAFTPWPGVYINSGLKIKKMKLSSDTGCYEKGKILKIDECAEVGCENGSIEVCRVQPPSKKEMNIKDYLNGKRIGVADTLA